MKYTKLALIGLLLTGSTVQAGSAAAAGVGGGVGGLLVGRWLCPKDSDQVADLKAENAKLKEKIRDLKRKKKSSR